MLPAFDLTGIVLGAAELRLTCPASRREKTDADGVEVDMPRRSAH